MWSLMRLSSKVEQKMSVACNDMPETVGWSENVVSSSSFADCVDSFKSVQLKTRVPYNLPVYQVKRSERVQLGEVCFY